MKYAIIIFFLLFVSKVEGAHWCKVIYKKGTQQGELKQQLNRCKNSDNIFIAIHSEFLNAGHLLNSMIAENCDIRKEIVSTSPRKGDPYFTAVCEFRRHFLRKD